MDATQSKEQTEWIEEECYGCSQRARSALAARSRWSVHRDTPKPLRLLTCSRPCIYKLARPVWLLFFFFFLLWLCMVVKEALATRFPSTASCTRDIIQSPSPLQSGKRI